MWSAPVNWSHSKEFVDADFARQLEHELNAAKAELAFWKTGKGAEGIVNLQKEISTLKQQRTNIHTKLIELLHKHGTGETEEHDGEKIDEMVERMAAELAELRKKQELIWQHCKVIFWDQSPEGVLGYPVEHNPLAGKDSRAIIEEFLSALSSQQPKGEQ